jgi:hypothetical protein
MKSKPKRVTLVDVRFTLHVVQDKNLLELTQEDTVNDRARYLRVEVEEQFLAWLHDNGVEATISHQKSTTTWYHERGLKAPNRRAISRSTESAGETK